MTKLFKIDDFVKDEGKIILFCSKNGKEFEIKFDGEKFIDWMRHTDRLNTQLNEWSGTDHIGYIDSIMSEDEYWGLAQSCIASDLYEYVILRLVAPHELFNGTEKALLSIVKQTEQIPY